jgi:hypothetical protein
MTSGTALLERPAAPGAAAAGAPGGGRPLPRAIVVGGLFPRPPGLLKALRALRSAGATNDVVGLAIPLEGDPTAPDTPVRVAGLDRRRRFDPVDFLLTVLDPHRPPPQPDGWARGPEGPLAQGVLGDLTHWLVGVYTFRVPLGEGLRGPRASPPGGDGVWVLGRPSHAAAIHGARGAALEGAAGALASLGVPERLAARYAERLAAGESILTVCETDPGRARRDERILSRQGAVELFEHPLVGEYVRQS